MFINRLDLTRWNRISIGFGGIAWMLVVLLWLLGWIVLDNLEILLLLAVCVITPLAVPLVTLPRENRLLRSLARAVLFTQPFATLIGGASLLMSRGPFEAALAIAWLLFTVLIALIGLLLLFQKNGQWLVNASMAVAFIYLPMGGIWFVLDRLGMHPLGFSQTIVLLTAVHFHFITLAALLITGLTGRAIEATQQGMPWNIYHLLAGSMLVTPLLVAAGITTTQITGSNVLETVAACLFASCMILIALFHIRFIVPTTLAQLARGLLFISSSSIIFTMLFAGAYAIGDTTGIWTITISQMILIHGWVNALVFGLCGLLGWRIRIEQRKR